MFPETDTPALLIDDAVLERNLVRMQALANQFGVGLRPHIKTHKMPQLAIRQVTGGAQGIAVAKLSEAEAMARHGLDNIQIANQIVGSQKIARMRALAHRVRLSCAVDSPLQVREISQAFEQAVRPIELLIEIDTGLHRCGLTNADDVIDLAKCILASPGVRLAGLMTHAGHAYATVGDPEKRRAIAQEEGSTLTSLAAKLRDVGIKLEVISVGSTPTAGDVVQVPGISELRVGNYVFNDMIQVALGVAALEDCALTVLATVISVPSEDRIVIDAGAKALSLDLGAHGVTAVRGYGKVLGHDTSVLARLSEEHGVITHAGAKFQIGQRLRIVPNHACATVNLYDRAFLLRGDEVVDQYRIEARGCLT